MAVELRENGLDLVDSDLYVKITASTRVLVNQDSEAVEFFQFLSVKYKLMF